MTGRARILLLFLLAALVGCAPPSGSRVILMAEANVSVSEVAPDRKRAEGAAHVLSAGIGRGLREGQLISYVRFDLSEIPDSTPTSSIMVESGRLRLLALAYGLADRGARFLVTVSTCADSMWDEREMTWNSRVCANGLAGEDSVIIEGYGLPQAYTWDVTRGVARAKATGSNKITFVLIAHRLLDCDRDPLEGIGCPEVKRVEFVRFASRERPQFGVSAVPTLVVSHTSHPTPLLQFFSSMFAFLSAIGVTFGIYEGLRRIRRKRAR